MAEPKPSVSSDDQPSEASPTAADAALSVHLLTLRNLASVSDPRGWSLSSHERRGYMGRVAAGTLTSGDGNVYGEHHPVKMTNRLRSAASVVDPRAWSHDPGQQRSFMRDMICRSPPASTSDLRHQEVLAQLRQDSLPHQLVDQLLNDKNQQIDDLEHSIKQLRKQSTRAASAGDPSSSFGLEVVDAALLSEASPEVLRHAASASAVSDQADLSVPDVSLVHKSQERSPRPTTPGGSEHSWGSAPTVAGSQLGSRLGSAADSERSSSATRSGSGDSVHQLRVALQRKKQLLNARKQQLEVSGRPETPSALLEPPPPPPPSTAEHTPQPPLTAEHTPSPVLPPPPPSTTEHTPSPPPAAPQQQQEEVEQMLRSLEQLRSRLQVLDPIMARLDSDYTDLCDGVTSQKAAASETEMRVMSEVAEMRQLIGQQDAACTRLEQRCHQLRHEERLSESEPRLQAAEQQLLATLRDMEINKLEACSKMHEAAALLARSQRHSQQEVDSGSNLASSGYISMSPRQEQDERPPQLASPPANPPPSLRTSPPTSLPPSLPASPPASPPTSPPTSPPASPRVSPPVIPPVNSAASQPLSPRNNAELCSPASLLASPSPTFERWKSAGTGLLEISEAGTETELEMRPEADDGDRPTASCFSLFSEMSSMSDMDAEVERLRLRVGELERQLSERRATQTPPPPPPSQQLSSEEQQQWLQRLEAERAAWSEEREQLQQRLAEQQRQDSGRGHGDQQELGKYMRAESHRRALCWQKRYLMVLLGGYQETEVMTLQRMAQLTDGSFKPDARRYLPPLRKLRAAAWALVALARMRRMVTRWKGRRAAALAAPPPGRPLSPAASCGSDMTDTNLSALERVVRECSSSVPDLRYTKFDSSRSVASVSEVCTVDLEPYLTRFDALFDRQGYSPQPAGPPR